MQPVKLPFYARLALVLVSIVLILFLLNVGKTIFIPLFFGLLISVVLFPVTRFFERLHLGRALSAIISIALFLVLIGGLIYFLSLQIVNFSKDIPKVEARLTEILHNIQNWISSEYKVNSGEQMDYISKSASSVLAMTANYIGNTFLAITELFLWIVFILIYTFFLLYHRKLLTRFVLALFNREHRSEVFEVINETRSVINSYIIGLLIEMVIIAVLNSTLLGILGIQYALLMGVLAAVLNIIPYLGIYTAIVLSMIITFANGTGGQALETGLILLGIHIIDANILLPRIVGGRVKMNPFITIIAVVAGNLLWGIPGMFLFIPLTAIIKIISEKVYGLKPWAILIGEDDSQEQDNNNYE